MKELINRVQEQLDNNHYVEAEDIQALVDELKPTSRIITYKKLLSDMRSWNPIVLKGTEFIIERMLMPFSESESMEITLIESKRSPSDIAASETD